jgi:hypothetical protein
MKKIADEKWLEQKFTSLAPALNDLIRARFGNDYWVSDFSGDQIILSIKGLSLLGDNLYYTIGYDFDEQGNPVLVGNLAPVKRGVTYEPDSGAAEPAEGPGDGDLSSPDLGATQADNGFGLAVMPMMDMESVGTDAWKVIGDVPAHLRKMFDYRVELANEWRAIFLEVKGVQKLAWKRFNENWQRNDKGRLVRIKG